MAVTISVDGTIEKIPAKAAATLADELRAYADGYRGACEDPEVARSLASAIDDRLNRRGRGAIEISSNTELEVLRHVLNAIVYEIGPAMKLYNAVDMALRAA